MNKLSYKIIFNKIDTNGFSISDISDIEIKMNEYNNTFLEKSTIINKLVQNDYKLIYEIVPSCDLNIKSLSECKQWFNICLLYKTVIYPLFKDYKYIKVNTSIDYSNFYLKSAYYKYIVFIKNKDAVIDLIKFIGDHHIKIDNLNEDILITSAVSYEDKKNEFLYTVYCNSLLPIALINEYYINKYKNIVEFTVQYIPLHISNVFDEIKTSIDNNKGALMDYNDIINQIT